VAWNETRWSDPEFSKLLTQANGILNVDERRKVFCKLEDIQQSRGSIGIPFWRNAWYITRKNVQDITPVASIYMTINEAWLA
jgi:peptide/nickel transport system substrate-binding protein